MIMKSEGKTAMQGYLMKLVKKLMLKFVFGDRAEGTDPFPTVPPALMAVMIVEFEIERHEIRRI